MFLRRFHQRFLTTTRPARVFEDSTKFWHKERIARNDPEGSRQADYIWNETAVRLIDRLADLKKPPSGRIIELGSGPGRILRNDLDGRLEGVKEMHLYDPHPSLLNRDDSSLDSSSGCRIIRTVGSECLYDSSNQLPFPKEHFDLALTNLALHWVNDLAGCIGEVKRILKPDSPFVGAMIGGETLYELR